jgi:hypothetical protein
MHFALRPGDLSGTRLGRHRRFWHDYVVGDRSMAASVFFSGRVGRCYDYADRALLG